MWESIGNDSCDACQCANSRAKRTESSFDKENIQQALSPIKSQELSFYSNSTTTTTTTTTLCSGDTSPNHCTHNLIRRPLEDHDTNSRDSGYLTNYNSNSDKFSFHSPSNQSYKSGMDDEFLEDFSDIEPLDDNLPKDFNKLITGPIDNKSQEQQRSPKDLPIRPLFRRALSLNNEIATPSRVRSCLFNTDVRTFKRPEPPLDFPNVTISKKIKLNNDENDSDDGEISTVPFIKKPIFKRSFSTTEESIMWAVQKSSTEPDLIGDFTKTFCLPLTPGRHRDLKSITPQTLAKLLRGDFNSNILSFKVIDCRYPYEFEGGHINGAINIYTKDQCMDLLTNFAAPIDNEDTNKRNNILVFHCEFSSERGPNLCRYLRKQDRQLNQDSYPSLHYPEMYLLEGGYKNFFEQYSHLCVPNAYKEMLHPEHVDDLRYFRLKSKTWNVDSRRRPSQGYSKKLAW